MPPFCPQCGVDNPPTARFCDQCGAVLIPVPGAGAPAAQAAPVAPTPTPATPAPGASTPATASAGPSTCPQCGTAVIPGEAFCDNCGAALLGSTRPATPAAGAPSLPFGGVPPQPSYPAPQPVAPAATPGAAQPIVTPPIVTPPVAPAPAAPPRVALAPGRLLAQPGGAVIPLPLAPQAVIGRADAVSNFFPDIDLTPHGALDNGVGRRHLRLFIQGTQVLAEDLDSTNGTFLNGNRLSPRQPVSVKSGDELRLGKLLLRVEL